MFKLKRFKEEKEEETVDPAQDRQKNIIRLIVCVVGLVLIFAYVKIVSSRQNSVNYDSVEEQNLTISEINKNINAFMLNSNKYQISIKKDDVTTNMNLDLKNNTILLNKEESSITYTQVDDNYVNENNEVLEIDSFIINIDNIISLLNLNNKTEDLYNEKIYYINVEDVLNLYNRVSNTSYVTDSNNNIKIIVSYNDNDIKEINFDYSEIYNIINNTNSKIEYNIVFDYE